MGSIEPRITSQVGVFPSQETVEHVQGQVESKTISFIEILATVRVELACMNAARIAALYTAFGQLQWGYRHEPQRTEFVTRVASHNLQRSKFRGGTVTERAITLISQQVEELAILNQSFTPRRDVESDAVDFLDVRKNEARAGIRFRPNAYKAMQEQGQASQRRAGLL